MIAEIVTWLNTLCHSALPPESLVEFGAAAEKRAPVCPSIQVVFGQEDLKWIASRVAREKTASAIKTRRRLYDRVLPARITITHKTLADVEQSLVTILRGCDVGLKDDAGNYIRVTPGSVKWIPNKTLNRQNEQCLLDVTFGGGLYVDATHNRITGALPEPEDQEDTDG